MHAMAVVEINAAVKKREKRRISKIKVKNSKRKKERGNNEKNSNNFFMDDSLYLYFTGV